MVDEPKEKVGGGVFPKTRWFSGGKWGLPPMKRDILSRFAIAPCVGVRIETLIVTFDGAF